MTAVKSSCCSSRGPGFGSLGLYWVVTQLPLLPGDPTPCSGFWGRWDLHACGAHTYTQAHTYTTFKS